MCADDEGALFEKLHHLHDHDNSNVDIQDLLAKGEVQTNHENNCQYNFFFLVSANSSSTLLSQVQSFPHGRGAPPCWEYVLSVVSSSSYK